MAAWYGSGESEIQHQMLGISPKYVTIVPTIVILSNFRPLKPLVSVAKFP